MTNLIESYEAQLAAITNRIEMLQKEKRCAAGNMMAGHLMRRIEALEEERSELQITISEMKKHL